MDFDILSLIENNVISALVLSGKITILSLLLHLLLGIPLAVLINNKKNYIAFIIDFIVIIPILFPPIVLGFFLLMLLGKNGIIGGFIYKLSGSSIIFSFTGVLIASFISGFPFMVKSVQSGMESIDHSLIEVSYSLGKGRIETFFRVILPNIHKSIITGAILSSGRSLGEVGITLMLGGNITGKTETISLAIYNAVFEGEYSKALFFSILLSISSLLLFISLKFLSKNNLKVL